MSRYNVGDVFRLKRDCGYYNRKYIKGEIVVASSDIYHCCNEEIEMPTRRTHEKLVCAFGIPYEELEPYCEEEFKEEKEEKYGESPVVFLMRITRFKNWLLKHWR